MRPSQKTLETISTIGLDIGKNTFHMVGLDKRGAIVLQQKVTRHQLEHRLSNIPRCLIGMEACSGTHFIARQLTALGHDVRVIPGTVRQAVPQGTQERLPRCGSGAAADHALRIDQDAGADESARTAPGALAPGQAAHGCRQSNPRLSA
jgi:hypothetical protein